MMSDRVPDSVEILARGVALRGDDVLVCRNVKHGYCFLPGGHVEPGEAASEACAREFMEESGMAVRVGPLLLVAEARFEQAGRSRHEINLVFHVEPDAASWPQDVPSLERKIAFEWVARDQLHAERFLPAFMAD